MHLEPSFIYVLKTALTKYEVIPAKRKVSSSIQASSLKNLGSRSFKNVPTTANSRDIYKRQKRVHFISFSTEESCFLFLKVFLYFTVQKHSVGTKK